MSTASGGARRILQFLVAVILIACSFPYAARSSEVSNVFPQQHRALAAEALKSNVEQGDGEVATVQDESPEELLARGTALLQDGNSKEAVDVLNAAVAAWKEQVRGR